MSRALWHEGKWMFLIYGGHMAVKGTGIGRVVVCIDIILPIRTPQYRSGLIDIGDCEWSWLPVCNSSCWRHALNCWQRECCAWQLAISGFKTRMIFFIFFLPSRARYARETWWERRRNALDRERKRERKREREKERHRDTETQRQRDMENQTCFLANKTTNWQQCCLEALARRGSAEKNHLHRPLDQVQWEPHTHRVDRL